MDLIDASRLFNYISLFGLTQVQKAFFDQNPANGAFSSIFEIFYTTTRMFYLINEYFKLPNKPKKEVRGY